MSDFIALKVRCAAMIHALALALFAGGGRAGKVSPTQPSPTGGRGLSLALAVVLLFAPPALAAECATGETAHVAVKGLVCDFCARALEKTFSKKEEVKGITVDLEHGMVTVAMQPGRDVDDATLKQLITDAGYNVETIDRSCS